MRDIRFRVWDKTHSIMWYSSDSNEIVVGENTVYILDTEPYAHEHSDCVPMQYTGIKDKHGTDVYEGDILCYRDEDGDKQYWPVSFENGCFVVNGSAIWDYLRYDKNDQPTNHLEASLEVVGNIYNDKDVIDEPR